MARKNTTKSNRYRDLIVVGAGASGLMAAITAARSGASVVVLNHHADPGRKILSTGNGKCNFTNEVQEIRCYHSDDPDLVSRSLERFSWKDTIAFFEELGVYAKQKNGYYYPLSEQASTIRNALLDEAEHLHVEIVNEVNIADVSCEDGIFFVEMKPESYEARRCILATGGKAAPKTGSDGTGYVYAVGMGHTLISPLPALVPLTSKERWLRRMNGVRCDGSIVLLIDGQEAASERGELQFADGAVSGIPVFQVSRFASVALSERHRVEAVLDLSPDFSAEELSRMLMDGADRLGGYKSWYQIISGICNQKIAAMLCEKLNLPYVPAHQFSRETGLRQSAAIASELKHTVVPVSGTGYMEYAQTTCGGIPLAEIGPDMQSKIVPGLYFAGEILNVDGACGGYNLQWAWTSGYLAGLHAAE